MEILEMRNQSEMIIYQTEDGLTKVNVTFEEDTVWLTIDQMASLFQRDRSVIGKHVRNILKEGELQKESVWANFAHTAEDGKAYKGATLMSDHMSGDFPVLKPGQNAVSWSGNVTRVIVRPNWRYL